MGLRYRYNYWPYDIAKALAILADRPRIHKKNFVLVLDDKMQAIRWFVASGAPASDIATCFHITRQRVYQLRKRLGVQNESGSSYGCTACCLSQLGKSRGTKQVTS